MKTDAANQIISHSVNSAISLSNFRIIVKKTFSLKLSTGLMTHGELQNSFRCYNPPPLLATFFSLKLSAHTTSDNQRMFLFCDRGS
jgi:hypothetical protein